MAVSDSGGEAQVTIGEGGSRWRGKGTRERRKKRGREIGSEKGALWLYSPHDHYQWIFLSVIKLMKQFILLIIIIDEIFISIQFTWEIPNTVQNFEY